MRQLGVVVTDNGVKRKTYRTFFFIGRPEEVVRASERAAARTAGASTTTHCNYSTDGLFASLVFFLLCLGSLWRNKATMPVGRQKLAVFIGAVALRLLLIVTFPSLPDLLTSRVEVSTPISSFKRRELPVAFGGLLSS